MGLTFVHPLEEHCMIDRYSRECMRAIWSEHNKYATWLAIEIKACEALCELGTVPPEALANIKKKAAFDVVRIAEIEEITRHDVIAFTTSVAEYVGEDARYIHWGLTSSDVLDTSFSMLLKEASKIILQDIDELLAVLKERAYRTPPYRNDRPQPRHSCRAGHVRTQDGPVVR